MSIMDYNGSAIIAMKGKKCVAIASDLRFGVRNTTYGMDMSKVFKMHDRLMVGLSGLATDMQTLSQRFAFRHKMYKLREDRDMKASTFTHFVANMLYEKRFAPYFVAPVIAGLEPDGTPVVATSDTIGCMEQCDDFAVCGTSTESMLGPCESFWRPELEPEELFEVISQALLSAVGRDASSGWGGVVHVITEQGTFTRTVKMRMD